MRIPVLRKPNRDDGDPMTPMIDVVFLLLIFFICASVGTVVDDLLPLELSGTSAEANPVQQKPSEDRWDHPLIQIRLQQGPGGMEMQLEQQAIANLESLAERLARLAAADPGSAIVLNIADEVQAQDFITVYDLCQSLKFEKISFAVHAPGTR